MNNFIQNYEIILKNLQSLDDKIFHLNSLKKEQSTN